MAKRKQDFLVRILPYCLQLWYDGPLSEIEEIEGVIRVDDLRKHTGVSNVHIDARYDLEEVTSEIESLLSAKIPDVFLEDKE